MPQDELKLLASKSFPENYKLYEVIDFLNKSLKNKNIIFGLKKNTEDNNKISIYIYET